MDSLNWSKKYEVLSISRLYLRSLGFSNEEIESLSDDDMQRIAEKLNNDYFIEFEEHRCHSDCCGTMYNEKVLNAVQT